MKNLLVLGLLVSLALTVHASESGTISESATPAASAAVNGAIGYSGASFAVNQTAASVIITAIRGGATKGTLSATYTTINGSAIAGTNYTAKTGTLSWANGDGSSKTFTVPVDTSPVFAGTKNFVVKLTAGANTILGSHSTATVTITGGTKAPTTGWITFPDNLPGAGSSGTDAIPTGAGLEDTSHPTHVIGNGSPASCTSAAVVAAVKTGGIITFECGSAPVTIQMTATAQVFNNGASKTVIDGGGLVTLSGMKQRRILYMNTCDESLVWTTSRCDNQEYPQVTVQNITFSSGNVTGLSNPQGGAIYASGGRFKAVNSRFFSNVCPSNQDTITGGAIYAFEQYQSLPVYVVHSTFGGESTLGNTCSNGGALGSIDVSWTLVDSLLEYNHAVGPSKGGAGGAIYNDGDAMVLSVNGSQINYNSANIYGSAIFFTSNNLTGSIAITDSTIEANTGGSWYDKYPGISAEASTPITVKNSTIVN